MDPNNPETSPLETPPTVEQVATQLQSQIDATSQCQSQLHIALAQVSNLQKERDELQLTHESDLKEIIALNGALEAVSHSNKDYASEVLRSESLVKSLHDYLYAIADNLDIKRHNIQDNDLAEKCLAKIDALDTLTASQYDQIQKLRKLPLMTPRIITDIKKNFPQTIARTIIGFFIVRNG